VMTAADLNRFLMVCALVSDLYCSGYNPRQSLAKDSNLARAAARYKIDTAKMSDAIRLELSKAKEKRKSEKNGRSATKTPKRQSTRKIKAKK
jgi:hypothetical protein